MPGESAAEGQFLFDVDDQFSLAEATLIIGSAGANKAIVPIGSGGEDLISLEPREIPVAGSASAGAVTVTVARAELRADVPESHDEVEDGKIVLTIFFSATPVAGIQLGRRVLQSENFVLELPNGSAVPVRSDGGSGVSEVLEGKEGTTIPGLKARFEIPAAADGAFALILRGNYGPEGAEVEGRLAFQIKAPSPTP